MRKLRKKVNNLIIHDASPRGWREVCFQVKTPNGKIILEEFGGGEEGKKKAIEWASKTKDYLIRERV